MGYAVMLVVLWLLDSLGKGSSGMENPAPWSSLGSRSSAPGIVPDGSRSQAVGQAVSAPSPVAMRCQEANMVVTVQRDFFGNGYLIQAADLRLGAAFCRPTATNADNTITFEVALQDCGNTLQITPGWLVYSSVLTYNPATPSNRAIIRGNPVAVLIQCFYPRSSNVSSNAIKPTWHPFSSTLSLEGSLSFTLRLMNDDWSAARTNTTFQLGDTFNIEASVETGNHVPMRIFVDRCVATLSPDKGSRPSYDLITYNGCLVDGTLLDSSSSFLSSRTRPNQLRFKVDAFRFTGDASSMVYITCNLKAVVATQVPDALNKACSYIKGSNGWSPVEGPSSICSCCEMRNCASPAQVRGLNVFGVPGSRGKRTIVPKSEEMVAVLGPLVVLTHEESSSTNASHGAVKELGLVSMAAAVLSLGVLGTVALYKRGKRS